MDARLVPEEGNENKLNPFFDITNEEDATCDNLDDLLSKGGLADKTMVLNHELNRDLDSIVHHLNQGELNCIRDESLIQARAEFQLLKSQLAQL